MLSGCLRNRGRGGRRGRWPAWGNQGRTHLAAGQGKAELPSFFGTTELNSLLPFLFILGFVDCCRIQLICYEWKLEMGRSVKEESKDPSFVLIRGRPPAAGVAAVAVAGGWVQNPATMQRVKDPLYYWCSCIFQVVKVFDPKTK